VPETELGPENFKHRMAHVHTFDSRLVARMLDASGFNIVAMDVMRPFNIIALAQRGAPRNNSRWFSGDPEHLRKSPFKSDRPFSVVEQAIARALSTAPNTRTVTA